MILDNYLRIAFMLEDNQASTFNANTRKMVKLVLFDADDKGLCIQNIINNLKLKYDLEFSEKDIHDAIVTRKDYGFVQIYKDKDFINSVYTISEEEFEKIGKIERSNSLSSLVTSFISIYVLNLSQEQIINLIFKFLYYIFESNYNMILPLMSRHNFTPFNDCGEETFTDDEKKIINNFLSWDNKEKDDFIYNAVVCCIDYCMMTLKKDASSYRQLFRGKSFYLDTNIIFRLCGINGENRRISTESFINKCIEVGISINYSNITLNEIHSTIEHHIAGIKSLLGYSTPLRSKHIQKLTKSYSLDFYDQYVLWVKQNNCIGDYSTFEEALKNKVKRIVRGFNFVAFEPFDQDTRFLPLCDDFYTYKINCKKNTHYESIKIDINNYLYLQKVNKSVGESTFLNVKNYIITADHPYVEWAIKRVPSVVPTVVLPSVWYSIILKYNGRVTTDDFRSFSQFLMLRINHKDNSFDKRKEELLTRVLMLNQEVEIKERIIDDIDLKLSSDYKELNEQEIIEAAFDSVVNDKVQSAVENERALAAIKAEEFEAQHIESLESQKKDSYLEGLREGRIEASAKTRRVIYSFIFYTLLLALVAIGIYILIWLFTNDLSEFRNFLISDWVLFVATIFTTIVLPFLKKKFFCDFDNSKIFAQVQRSYIKKERKKSTR